jgi:hypothetical protein
VDIPFRCLDVVMSHKLFHNLDVDSDINFRTGERTNYSVFLEGFDYFTEVIYIEKKLKIT